MRKFKFTLQTLLRIKEAKEKQLKQELAEAERLLRIARQELAALFDEFEDKRAEHNEKLKSGAGLTELNIYSLYFSYLRERIQLQQARVRRCEAERLKRQSAVVEIMKEVKTLIKLKEAQYAEYLLELKLEQEKEIGDFVSFKVVSK